MFEVVWGSTNINYIQSCYNNCDVLPSGKAYTAKDVIRRY